MRCSAASLQRRISPALSLSLEAFPASSLPSPLACSAFAWVSQATPVACPLLSCLHLPVPSASAWVSQAAFSLQVLPFAQPEPPSQFCILYFSFLGLKFFLSEWFSPGQAPRRAGTLQHSIYLKDVLGHLFSRNASEGTRLRTPFPHTTLQQTCAHFPHGELSGLGLRAYD